MATAKLGTIDSRPSNIILGGDDIVAGTEFDRTIEDTLSLVDEVGYGGDIRLSIESTLSLISTANTAGSEIQYSLSSTLTLTDVARPSSFVLHIEDTLSLVDAAEGNFQVEECADVLALEDEVTVAGSISPFASSALALVDTVDVSTPVKNESIGNELALTDQVNLHYELTIVDTLSLLDEAQRIIAVEDTLVLVQSASLGKYLTIQDTLELVDTAEENADYEREIATDLGIEHVLTYFLESPGTECGYTPFVGDGPDDPAPPSTTPPTLGYATLTLTYPYVTPTTTLVLRNPDFGNQRTLNFSRIFRPSRGGSLEVFADPTWPKTETLSLTIDGLSATQAEDFLEFLGTSLGKRIGLLDWENRQWRGIITTSDAEVTDNGTCRNVISFDFEGELA